MQNEKLQQESIAAKRVTACLAEAKGGSQDSLNRLFELIYEQLHRIASHQMSGQQRDYSPTVLVHDAYTRLLGAAQDVGFECRAQFFGLASTAMRRLLIDHVRQEKAQKRGGNQVRVPLDDTLACVESLGIDLLSLNEALESLGNDHPRQARFLEQSVFGGYTNQEIADLNEVSLSTVEKSLRFARAWLRTIMNS